MVSTKMVLKYYFLSSSINKSRILLRGKITCWTIKFCCLFFFVLFLLPLIVNIIMLRSFTIWSSPFDRNGSAHDTIYIADRMLNRLQHKCPNLLFPGLMVVMYRYVIDIVTENCAFEAHFSYQVVYYHNVCCRRQKYCGRKSIVINKKLFSSAFLKN